MKIPGMKVEAPEVTIPEMKLETPEVDLGRLDLGKLDLGNVDLGKLDLRNVDLGKLGRNVDLGKLGFRNVDLKGLDAEAIGQAIVDRLPRRRGSSPMPLVMLGVLWGAALGWFAFARSAAPLRASMTSWIEETKQRLPSAVDDVRDWAGGAVYRAGDRVEHSGDAMEHVGPGFYRPGDLVEHAGDGIERVGEALDDPGIETPPIG